MSRIFNLGVFRLGDENVRVMASADYKNSSCISSTDSRSVPLLRCKLPEQWHHAVAEMTHEAMEWSMARRDCGWNRQNAVRTCSDSVMYQMNHSLLDDVACDTGCFLAEVLPELAKVFAKRKQSGKCAGGV